MLTPAQLTRMWTRPWRERIAFAASSTASRSAMSTASASAWPPAWSMRSWVSASAVARRPDTTTFAPALASSTAAAWPIPLPPPVTHAIFPLSAPMLARFRAQGENSCGGLGSLQDRRQGRVEHGADRAQQLSFGKRESSIGHHDRHAGLDENGLLQRGKQLQLAERAVDPIEAELLRGVKHAALDPERLHPLVEREHPSPACAREQRQHDRGFRGKRRHILVLRRILRRRAQIAPQQGQQHEFAEADLRIGLDQAAHQAKQAITRVLGENLERRQGEGEYRKAQARTERREDVGKTGALRGEVGARVLAHELELPWSRFARVEQKGEDD